MEYRNNRPLRSAHISLLVRCMLPEYTAVEQSYQGKGLRGMSGRGAAHWSIEIGESVDFPFYEQIHKVRVKLTAAEQADLFECDLG